MHDLTENKLVTKIIGFAGAKFKRYLPDLSEAITGICSELNRDPEQKKNLKKLAGWAFLFDLAEFALVIGPAWMMGKSPKAKAYMAEIVHAPQPSAKESVADLKAIFNDLPKFLKTLREIYAKKPEVFLLMAATVADMGRNIVAIAGGALDIKLFGALFKINRNRIGRKHGEKEAESETESDGIVSTALKGVSDIATGLSEDPSLRAKFIGLAMLEVTSDVVDAKLGVGRHFPALAASVLFSQVIALKELDLTARAIDIGVAAKIRDADDPEKIAGVPALHLMEAIGMKRQAATIARHVNEHPALETALKYSASFTRMGFTSFAMMGTSYAIRWMTNPLATTPMPMERKFMEWGLGVMCAGIMGTGSVFGASYLQSKNNDPGPG